VSFGVPAVGVRLRRPLASLIVEGVRKRAPVFGTLLGLRCAAKGVRCASRPSVGRGVNSREGNSLLGVAMLPHFGANRALATRNNGGEN